MTAPDRPTPGPAASSLGWEPLRPHRSAALAHPRERSVAAYQAAAEAASRAGVLDVAAYWWAEAHALAPSPALAQALQQARAEAGLARSSGSPQSLDEARARAGFARPAAPPAPLDRELARALRAAVEAHAWDQVLALTEPALAAAPHHDLYFWAGDALWQQGHEAAARRMWSRARVLLRAAGAQLAVDLPELGPASRLTWSAGGLAFIRQHGDSSRWLELWSDSLERPWLRQYIASDRMIAWTEGGATLAEVDDETLVVRDPASGAGLVRVRAHTRAISRLAAAAAAPVLATHATAEDIKIWRWPAGVPKDMSLEPAFVSAGADDVLLALDPSGQRLAIAPPGRRIELVELATGARRTLAPPARTWKALQLLDRDVALAVHGAGVVQRVGLVEGVPGERQVLREVVDLPYEHPAGSGQLQVLAVAATGKLAVTCDRGHLLLCGERGDECHADETSVIAAAAYAPDGQRLAYVYQDNHVLLRDLATARRKSISRGAGYRRTVVGVAADGGALAVDGERGLAVWDTRSGTRRLQRQRSHFLGFSPDGATVAVLGEEQPGVELHPLAGGPALRLPLPSMARTSVGFSRDGRRLAVNAGDELAVWDLSSGTALWREQVPDGADGLTFTARDELIYQSGAGIQIRDAAGRRPARTLTRSDDFHEWSVAPGGAQIFACIDHDTGSVLLDVRTGRVRRRWRELCGGTFVTDSSVLARQDLQMGLLDLRTGQRRTPGAGDPLVASDAVKATHGGVVLARVFDRRGSVRVLDRDGRLLADVHPRGDLGWFAVTADGAIDGDPGAFLEADSVLGDQRYPATLAWDSASVPGLLPRLFAGEAVKPPIAVAGP